MREVTLRGGRAVAKRAGWAAVNLKLLVDDCPYCGAAAGYAEVLDRL